MLRKLIVSIMVITSLAFLLGGFGYPQKEPIKIGHIIPRTGLFGPYGIRTAKGAPLAVKQINANGGMNGRPVELYPVDTEASPEVAVNKVRRLITKKGVDLLVGTASSSVASAIAAEATAQKVPFLNVGAYTQKLTQDYCSKYVFTTLWNNIQVQAGAAYLVKDQPWETIYNISPDYVFGHEAWTFFLSKLQELRPANDPIVVAGSDFPSFGTTDYSAYIAKIKAKKPDAIFSSLWASDEIAFLKQALQFGLFDEVKNYISGAAVPDEVSLALGPEGMQAFREKGVTIRSMTIYDPGWPDTSRNTAFKEAYRDEYGEFPYGKTWADYTAIYLIKAAIEKAGTADPEAIACALEDLEWVNEQGTWKVRGEDHVVIPEYLVGGKVQPGPFPIWTLSDIQTIPGEDVTYPVEESGCERTWTCPE